MEPAHRKHRVRHRLSAGGIPHLHRQPPGERRVRVRPEGANLREGRERVGPDGSRDDGQPDRRLPPHLRVGKGPVSRALWPGQDGWALQYLPFRIPRTTERRHDTIHAGSLGSLPHPNDSGASLVGNHRRGPAIGKSIAGRIGPASSNVTKDEQVTRLVRRLMLPSVPGSESTRHLRGVVTAAVQQGRRRALLETDGVHRGALVGLSFAKTPSGGQGD